MITEAQREILKVHLKNNYTSDVLSLLKKAKITNSNNKPYQPAAIRAVFNGTVVNNDIEDAILKVFANRKLEHEKREERKTKLLSA